MDIDIYEELKKIGVTVSEKNCTTYYEKENSTVPIKRIKTYSLDKEGITPEVDNIINRISTQNVLIQKSVN